MLNTDTPPVMTRAERTAFGAGSRPALPDPWRGPRHPLTIRWWSSAVAKAARWLGV